jgi:hypothetical protein
LDLSSESELWKLRCKVLADKYFVMLKDMKAKLEEVKKESQEEIKRAQEQLGKELILQLEKHLK